MKAIVFGGSGFIGSHVVEQLLLAGHQVTAAVRKESDTSFLKNIGANVTTIDFSEIDSIGTAIMGHEVIYNCTADRQVDSNKVLYEQEEIRLAKLLIEAAASHGASRFIQLSTIVVYDFRTQEPIDESYETAPEFPIQSIKLEKDKIIQELGHKWRIPVFILRPASTIGLRDRKSFFSRLFAAHMMDQFPLAGNGESNVSLIDTRDIGRAMVFLGNFQFHRDDNGIYLLKGFDTTWYQLKEEIDHAVGRIGKTANLPKDDVSFAGKTLSINRIWNDKKIRKAGFQPLYSLRDAVQVSAKELLHGHKF